MADRMDDETVRKVMLLAELAGRAAAALYIINQLVGYERDHIEYERLLMAQEIISDHQQKLLRSCQLISGVDV